MQYILVFKTRANQLSQYLFVWFYSFIHINRDYFQKSIYKISGGNMCR